MRRNFYFKLAEEELTFANLHKIYDPELTGIWDLVERRNELVKLGMKSSLADSLALRFISSVCMSEEAEVLSFIDLLENKGTIDP